MAPPTVSVVAITLNAQHLLPAMIDSARWADEIVVLDGGSEDATLEVARRAGCRVAVRKFDNFGAQRNAALELARGDWVFSIDADERFTPAVADEVRRRVRLGEHDGYRVPIRSRIFGRTFRFSGTQDDCPLRLVRRRCGHWEGLVHERLRVASGRVASLESPLEHETIADLREFLTKMNRYTRLEVDRRLAAGEPLAWGECWWSPVRETSRRLIYKLGLLDGPRGWAFCLLSGVSAWLTAYRHRRAVSGDGPSPHAIATGLVEPQPLELFSPFPSSPATKERRAA